MQNAKCVNSTHTHTVSIFVSIGRCDRLCLERLSVCACCVTSTHDSVPASEPNGPMHATRESVTSNTEAHALCVCACCVIRTINISIDCVTDRTQSGRSPHNTETYRFTHTKLHRVNANTLDTRTADAHFTFLFIPSPWQR